MDIAAEKNRPIEENKWWKKLIFQMGRIIIIVFSSFGKINCWETFVHSFAHSSSKVTKLVGIRGQFEKSFGVEGVPRNHNAIQAVVWLSDV